MNGVSHKMGNVEPKNQLIHGDELLKRLTSDTHFVHFYGDVCTLNGQSTGFPQNFEPVKVDD